MKKVSKKGFTLVELLVVIGILGILMGALFPVISSAMLSANLNSMSIQGRKLIMGIVQANIDRQGKADPLWPKEKDSETSTDEGDMDVASKCGSATEYFKALFDMEGGKYGSTEWNPSVDGELLSCLWGFGVPGMNGTSLEQRNIGWCMVKNIQDETPDFMPALITRNVTVTELDPKLQQFSGKDETKVTLGKANDTPFSNKGFVLVRKSGAAEAIKQGLATFTVIFNKQSFDNSSREKQLKFMEP